MELRNHRWFAGPPLYPPPSTDLAVEQLRSTMVSKARLDIPTRRAISGALETIATHGSFSPSVILVPSSQTVFERYLNHPRPPRAQRVVWPDQETVAESTSLSSSLIKPIILLGLKRVVRMATIENALERFVLPGWYHWGLVREGIIHVGQLLHPDDAALAAIWRVCGARPNYETLKARVRRSDPSWGPAAFDQLVFPAELPPEIAAQFIWRKDPTDWPTIQAILGNVSKA